MGSNNMHIVSGSTTAVGTTLENLKAAVTGETGASAKYAAYAQAAEDAGFHQVARLFQATSEAEKIHIAMETALVVKAEPDYQGPTATAPTPELTDLNLIGAANGEIYETSDMYPSFIKRAEEEGDTAAAAVFARAKAAEAFHAQRYLDAYSTIDTPSDETYYLCPVCGYIHKGSAFDRCPICNAPKDSFRTF